MNAIAVKAADIESVVFDFDYTLADSSPGVIECVNDALRRMGLVLASAEAIRQTIGLSLTTTFGRLTGERHPQRFDEFSRLLVERADQVMFQGIRLFGSVRPVVRALLDGGISLGIVSTKFRYRIEQVLHRDGPERAFEIVVGAEDVAVHKPDPTGLLAALGRLGTAPARALFVGDSVVDAETAEHAGVPFVAVLTGVTPREAFATYRPLAIIDDLARLPAVVLGGAR